jgi:CheY-like chemotaxis protein
MRAPGAPGERGAVLLVEDEEAIATLVALVLGRVGWTVHRARDGAESIRLAKRHGPQLALAIVDCRLPDMDGARLCGALRAAQPGLPVLLTSGQRPPAGALGAAGPTGFLPKPFRPADVQRQISALLEAVP